MERSIGLRPTKNDKDLLQATYLFSMAGGGSSTKCPMGLRPTKGLETPTERDRQGAVLAYGFP